MKKQKLIMFITLIVAIPMLLSATPEENIIKFKGFIEAGLYFSVSELPTDSFNLLTEDDLQPIGPGVDIGTWTLRVDNPPTEEPTYTIQYSFEPLSILGSDDEGNKIEFEVLERPSDSLAASADVKKTLDTTTIPIIASSGLNVFIKTVSARLTSDGMQAALVAAASPSYQSNIRITLLTE